MEKVTGAICGGIISESMWNKALDEGNEISLLMCFILPDKQFKKYWELKKKGKNKEAERVFKKYSWSVI